MSDRYFQIAATFVQLDASPDWAVTLHSYGTLNEDKDCRWLGNGSIDRFTLHDILKVLDCRLESELIQQLGLQTRLEF